MFSGLLLGQLPEAFQSIQEHQRKDTFCRTIYQKVVQGDRDVRNFKLLNGALICHPSRANGVRVFSQFYVQRAFGNDQNTEPYRQGIETGLI
jgi:hypothetical protein